MNDLDDWNPAYWDELEYPSDGDQDADLHADLVDYMEKTYNRIENDWQ